jgi:hypothetical protein
MADKLDWLDKHLVFIRYLTVADAVSEEAYKIPPELDHIFEGVQGAADAVFKLAEFGKHKNACELMAYIAHRRAAVWWGYRCLCSLNDELREKPPEVFDFENPPKPSPLPPYFNIEIPKPDPALSATMDAALAGARGAAGGSAALVNPEMKKYVADGVERAFQAFEKANGVHPMTLLKQLGERMKQDPYAIDPDSPIFRMENEINAKLDGQQKRIIAEIKTAHAAAGLNSPLNNMPKLEAHKKKIKGKAIHAVYRWIAAPNAENAQKCLDAGNACTGEPEGLLSLCTFWAFGNLTPQMEDRVIPTPPGLFANGLDKMILMCAVQQGGTRKIAERFEHYFNLGVDVLSGKDNWEDTLTSQPPPHEVHRLGAAGENNGYKRWRPEE